MSHRVDRIEPEVMVLPGPAQVAGEAAASFAGLAQEAVTARGRFSVALSGGSTPGTLFRLLAKPPYREQIPWAQVHLFWADERCVPAGDPGSNYQLAAATLIDHVPISPDNVHRVRGELAPDKAALTYEQALVDFFCGPRPRFDLVLLGMGSDGHTASLFPGSDALDERVRLALSVEATYEDRPAQRVTLTLPAINAARHVLFLVTGGAKANAVRDVLTGSATALPAGRIRPVAGALTWLLDAAAAGQLKG